jgi:hypothetical protein
VQTTDVNLVVTNSDPYYPQHPSLRRWQLFKGPLWLNYSDPTIFNPEGSTSLFQAQLSINTTFSSGDEQWLELLVTGPAEGSFASHPIHLHGHDFALLAQGNETFVPGQTVVKRGNPPRRDVALLPRNGFLLIAFKVDNPGEFPSSFFPFLFYPSPNGPFANRYCEQKVYG